MGKICDHRCSGIIIRRANEVLSIVRNNYPQAFALPAGHLDGDTPEVSSKKESEEEVGLQIVSQKLVFFDDIDNPCKREGGNQHEWSVFQAIDWRGTPLAGSDAKSFRWVSLEELKKMAEQTEYFMKKYSLEYIQVGDLTRAIFGNANEGKTDPEWLAEMGLEPVWYYILKSESVKLI